MRTIERITIVGDLIDDGGLVYKKCTKCKRSKPLLDFGFRRMNPGDKELLVQPQCKECRST